eukprot:3912018-Prymnesium_polylepis.1
MVVARELITRSNVAQRDAIKAVGGAMDVHEVRVAAVIKEGVKKVEPARCRAAPHGVLHAVTIEALDAAVVVVNEELKGCGFVGNQKAARLVERLARLEAPSRVHCQAFDSVADFYALRQVSGDHARARYGTRPSAVSLLRKRKRKAGRRRGGRAESARRSQLGERLPGRPPLERSECGGLHAPVRRPEGCTACGHIG